MNIKNRYQSKKYLSKMAQKIEKIREYREFKLYNEEEVFKPCMLRMEMMFRASLDPD